MRKLALLLAVGAMAGCGADGAPLRPSGNLGLSFGSDGVSPSASIGASNGTFSFGAGF